MWDKYFKYRSSENLQKMWSAFIAKVGFHHNAILYQFVTDELMNTVLKDIFPVVNEYTVSKTSLDYAEVNAIRYTAGYVLRALTKKVSRSANLLKSPLLKCIKEAVEGIVCNHYYYAYYMNAQGVSDESTELCDEKESEEWVNAIDRGGLIRVSEELYLMFESMELELRNHLKLGNDVNIKKSSIEEILKNEEVLNIFLWCLSIGKMLI